MAFKFSLIVPTMNAGEKWVRWIDAWRAQDLRPESVLILDSSSEDETASIAADAGFRVVSLDRRQFSHGGTRQAGLELVPYTEIICFLTQDAILAHPSSLLNLVSAFEDPEVGAAYGRQIPHLGAGPLESFPRLFNYPPESSVRKLDDAGILGIKVTFLSNSFAAYRREALQGVSGFPRHTILGEDTYVAAKLLLAGWKIAYCAGASVYHSHDYTLLQEFKRSFDIGVFHNREKWMIQQFGGAGGEGFRYVKSELAYLKSESLQLVVLSVVRSLVRFLGYQLGRAEAALPNAIKRAVSMHAGYWE